MATITKRGAGQYQVKVRRQGYPAQSETFGTKAAAEKWAREIENQLDKGIVIDMREAGRTTLKSALERYRTEITSQKQSNQPEKSRINTWLESPLAGRTLLSIRGSDLADYRDARSLGITIAELHQAREDDLELDQIKPSRRKVGGNSIRLELAVISHLYTICRTEWKMEGLPNPVLDIRKPKLPGARKRRLQEGEEKLLLDNATPPLRQAIILAIETAMRRGELCSLDRKQVHKGKKIAHLDKTKNGDERDVPLSPRAMEVIDSLPAQIGGSLLGITPDWLSHAFEDLTGALKIKDLHFHDLRREAISRLFEKGLGIEEVRTISGHKTLQMLTVYSKLRGEDLVKKLA